MKIFNCSVLLFHGPHPYDLTLGKKFKKKMEFFYVSIFRFKKNISIVLLSHGPHPYVLTLEKKILEFLFYFFYVSNLKFLNFQIWKITFFLLLYCSWFLNMIWMRGPDMDSWVNFYFCFFHFHLFAFCWVGIG